MSDNSYSGAERLKSRKLISKVFMEGRSMYKFPVRLVYLDLPRETDQILKSQVAFSVPKKKIKRAVDRNLLKRRMKEAYRLHRKEYFNDSEHYFAIVFVYQSDEIKDFRTIEKAVVKLLKRTVNRDC